MTMHDNGDKTSDAPGETRFDDVLEPERKSKLKQRLLASAGQSMTVVRGSDQDWERVLPGIYTRVLHCDEAAGVQTALWRMDAGAKIPAHPHEHDEECFVLEGCLEHRQERYHAGDYMIAPAGTRHATISSPDGALMLIRGDIISWKDRLMLRTALALGR